ncbi:MAG TPA: winged helix-turn-helix domain-containing protein [Lentzea sp.]
MSNDPTEDWVRPPISKDDLEARVKALQNRFDSRQVPILDSSGTLSYGSRSITISTTQTELMALLVERFGEVVYRNEFTHCLAVKVPTLTRNSLDLHIMRLRRRLLPVDLSIRTVWGRGYMLQATDS